MNSQLLALIDQHKAVFVGLGAVGRIGGVCTCIIAAGALVTQGAVIPDGSLAMGSPAKVRRAVTDEEIVANRQSAESYVHKAETYKAFLQK